MRMLLKAVIDTETGTEVFRSGKVAETLNQITALLKPEALYGFGEDGQRAFLIVFDLADPAQIPVVCEPLFAQAKAKITLTPCMNLEDLQKGVSQALEALR